MERITKSGYKFNLLNVLQGLNRYADVDEILNRLEAYEDTGLDPEEINAALREKRERESGRAQPENEPLTNAQRIRGMSDEELAEFLILSPEMEFEVCLYCKNGNPVPDDRGICLRPRGVCFANDRCEAFKDWLQQPAETEGTE